MKNSRTFDFLWFYNACRTIFPLLFATIFTISPSIEAALNPLPPDHPVKLVFIHHSTGTNWLSDTNGQLGMFLRNNNYFVSDTNYGWQGGGTDIGDWTDIGFWWVWFNGPDRDGITADLYAQNSQNADYSRMGSDPGGENEIILFKSCFPNSALKGSPDEPPIAGENPLRGKGSDSPYHTVGNAKGIYSDLLSYFATRQDKLFIAITAPPLSDGTYGANARAFNNWLVHDWLASYPYRNVAVFDFYNVLTSNGGNSQINDYGRSSGNHHRYNATTQTIEHMIGLDQDILAYPTGDDHPSSAGGRKATQEFIPLLNAAYHCWKGNGSYAPEYCKPLIEANDQDGQLFVASGTPITLSVSISPGDLSGANADWWVAVNSPWGLYFLTISGWSSLVEPVMQYPLLDLSSVPIQLDGLPAGQYTFCFAVDTTADSVISAPIFYDTVQVTVHDN